MKLLLRNATGAVVVLRAETGPEPRWNRIFPLGMVGYRPDFPGGKIEFTREYLETILQNWIREGRLPRQVNYLHRGDTSPDDLPLEEKVAAGWMEDLQLRDDGLYGLIRWTARAKAHIDADELRYLSPEFVPNGRDRVGGNPKGQGPTLCGCALLNDPFITDQERVAAGNNPDAARAAETNMNWKTKLIAVLALAATATDAEIEKALDEHKAQADKAAAEVKSLTAQLAETTGKLDLANKGATDDVVKLRTTLAETTTQLKAATDKITALETAQKTAAVDAYLDERVKAGVLTPAMLPGVKALALSTGLEQVKAIYDAAPRVVALGAAGIPGDTKELTPATALVKFNAAIDTIVKERGMKRSEARDVATRENPDLAKLAAKA